MRRLMVIAGISFAMLASGQTTSKGAGQKAAPAASKDTPTAAAVPTPATVDSFLKHMFSYDPNIQWQVLSIKPSMAPRVSEVLIGLKNPEGQQTMRLFVTPDQKWAIAGEMLPFGADPFAATNEQLAAGAHGPSRGPANADITLVEFSDLQCPACKAAQPTIDRLLNDVPQAHFIFQNFPLEQLHPWAFKAAEYADCVGRGKTDAFWKFLELNYQNQESVTTENADQKMKGFAAQAGADINAVAACVAQPATAARVRESIALGKAVDVTGTPTLFVNGRRIQDVTGVPYEILKQLVRGTPK